MKLNIIGSFIGNAPFGTEIAFKKGLERIGVTDISTIDTNYPDQQWNYDADFTIVFKWMERYWEDLDRCKGKKIVYQPDDIRFRHIYDMMRRMRAYCDYALTYDNEAVKIAERDLDYRKSNRLLLTADDELYVRKEDVEKDIDLCFIGSMTGGANHQSRTYMVNVLRNIGFNVHAEMTFDIDKIVDLYNRSKIILNHATDVGQSFGFGYGLQCRHFEAGMTGASVLSNRIINDEYDLINFSRFHDVGSLVSNVSAYLRNEELRTNLANCFYEEIKYKHLPQHRAQELVDFLESL